MTSRYAEVVVEAARNISPEIYTYRVPEDSDLQVGHRVEVPFGRRLVSGYVMEIQRGDPEREVKEISMADPDPLLLPYQMLLARCLAEHYWAPLIECVRAMLPPRVRRGKNSGGKGTSPRQTRHSHLLQLARGSGGKAGALIRTPEQTAALQVIRSNSHSLLYGGIDSGKTEVYLAAAAEVLSTGRGVLILVPELALTPQLVVRCVQSLGESVAVLHSGLTELERAQQWWRIRNGEMRVVLGSRSAIFAPLSQLGLICLDDEGSSSYCQERTPRYEASWVAARLAELTGAKLVFSSATPSIGTYYRALRSELALTELPRRISGRPARIKVVDMREELRAGNRLPLSRSLHEALNSTLNRREQVVLLLNRRGSATFLLCRSCGESIGCPGCSVSLVQHPELGGLACHYCGYVQGVPQHCPTCGAAAPRAMGMGTQRLASVVTKLWPQARVLRLDSDALQVREAYWEILDQFSDYQADILVGTQMVMRGIDLERVSTVGIVDADIPLRFPDYRAVERAFSLITQVIGRAARQKREGLVVVQSGNPEHFAISAAVRGDYRRMASQELAMRRAFGFPPMVEMATLTYRHPEEDFALERVEEVAEHLRMSLALDEVEGSIEVQGPAPAYPHRLRGEYRWQLTLKGKDLNRVRPYLSLGKGWICEIAD